MVVFLAELAFYAGIIPVLWGLAIGQFWESTKGWPLRY
jgi:hypothetical protein